MAITAEQLQKLITPQPKGWREELEDEQYHADKSAVNFSSLKHVDKSTFAFAKSYWGKPIEATKSMKFGTLAHMAILEGEKFRNKYVVMPEFASFDANGKPSDSKNTKYYKTEVANWVAKQSKDAIIVTEEEREKLFNMIDSVLSNEKAVKLLSDGKPEIAGYWTDQETGINLRMKADFLSFNLGVLVDVKTCQDVRWENFRKSVENYRYDIQIMMYNEGVKQITGKEPLHRAWLTIESEGAHEVRIHDVSPVYEEIGMFEYRRSLRKLKEAIDKNEFNQGSDEIIVGDPSFWFERKYLNLGVLKNV
jgi:hypothetical protein